MSASSLWIPREVKERLDEVRKYLWDKTGKVPSYHETIDYLIKLWRKTVKEDER